MLSKDGDYFMPMTEARKRANKKYDAKAYDLISFRFPKGKKAKLQAFAANRGESLNGFLNRAIDDYIAAHDADGIAVDYFDDGIDDSAAEAQYDCIQSQYDALSDAEKSKYKNILAYAESLDIELDSGVRETLYLVSIPGFLERFKTADAEPLDECIPIEEVWPDFRNA